MAGKQKTAAEQKQSRLELALRDNLARRKVQARARADGPARPVEKPANPQKLPDESVQKR